MSGESKPSGPVFNNMLKVKFCLAELYNLFPTLQLSILTGDLERPSSVFFKVLNLCRHGFSAETG